MSIKEIEELINLPVEKLEHDYLGFTHWVTDENTIVYLEIRGTGLVSQQIHWPYKMMRMAMFQRIQYCNDVPLRDGSSLQLPNNHAT